MGDDLTRGESHPHTVDEIVLALTTDGPFVARYLSAEEAAKIELDGAENEDDDYEEHPFYSQAPGWYLRMTPFSAQGSEYGWEHADDLVVEAWVALPEKWRRGGDMNTDDKDIATAIGRILDVTRKAEGDEMKWVRVPKQPKPSKATIVLYMPPTDESPRGTIALGSYYAKDSLVMDHVDHVNRAAPRSEAGWYIGIGWYGGDCYKRVFPSHYAIIEPPKGDES